MSLRPWRRLRRQSLLRIPPWLEVFRDAVELPDGREVDDYYTVELPDYAVVVALTTDQRLVVERHFRPGPGLVTWTVPSGFLDPGEEPLAAARRELLEETGYEANRWTSLGRFVVDGNRGCGWAHFFLARDARRTGPPRADDLAEIEVRLLRYTTLRRHLRTGEVAELATAAGLGLALIELGGMT